MFSSSFFFRSGLRKVLNSKTAAAASAASFDAFGPVAGGGTKFLRLGEPHRPPRRETSPRCEAVGEDVDESPPSEPTEHSVFASIPGVVLLLPFLPSNLVSFAAAVVNESGGVTMFAEGLVVFIAVRLLVSTSSFFSSESLPADNDLAVLRSGVLKSCSLMVLLRAIVALVDTAADPVIFAQLCLPILK